MTEKGMNRRGVMAGAAGLGAALGATAAGVAGAKAAVPVRHQGTRPSQGRSPYGGVWNHDEVALLLIDYQPEMFANLRSETPADLVEINTRLLIRTAKALDIPIILSTVAVRMGINEPTVPGIVSDMPAGHTVIDRTSMNAWEDAPFREAVKATGRKRLVVGALYTEICLAYPVVDALKDGHEVMFIEDAVGGQSQVAHAAGIARITQAGAVPNSAIGWAAETYRDWASAEAEKVRPAIVWWLEQTAALRGA